jgi:hypothetical protein
MAVSTWLARSTSRQPVDFPPHGDDPFGTSTPGTTCQKRVLEELDSNTARTASSMHQAC